MAKPKVRPKRDNRMRFVDTSPDDIIITPPPKKEKPQESDKNAR